MLTSQQWPAAPACQQSRIVVCAASRQRKQRAAPCGHSALRSQRPWVRIPRCPSLLPPLPRYGGHLHGPRVHFVLLAADTYENAIVTDHAASQMARRGVSDALLRSVLRNPGQVVGVRPGRVVLQSTVTMGTEAYVVRVFVDADRSPPEVVTVYRTSKVEKYWRE